MFEKKKLYLNNMNAVYSPMNLKINDLFILFNHIYSILFISLFIVL